MEKVAFIPSSIFVRIFLSALMIFPITFTGEYGLISPLFPIGVGPKNKQMAFPVGQKATSFRLTSDFAFSSFSWIGDLSV